MERKFGHPVVTGSDMLGIENQSNARAQVQHCCTSLAKRLNTSQHIATGWPNARNMLRSILVRT